MRDSDSRHALRFTVMRRSIRSTWNLIQRGVWLEQCEGNDRGERGRYSPVVTDIQSIVLKGSP